MTTNSKVLTLKVFTAFTTLLVMMMVMTSVVRAESNLHRYAECSYSGQYSACEPEIISSHYDREGNFYEVVILTDKDGNETVEQVMYKPVGFVPLGTGDEDYN